jgi:hypothetical protein
MTDTHYRQVGGGFSKQFDDKKVMCPFCGDHGPEVPLSCHYWSAACTCQHYIKYVGPHTELRLPQSAPKEQVNHPAHYGGADNPYETIKVIEAWGLGFCLGNAVKYISRAGKKDNMIQDLRKAKWYLDHEIARLLGEEIGNAKD